MVMMMAITLLYSTALRVGGGCYHDYGDNATIIAQG